MRYKSFLVFLIILLIGLIIFIIHRESQVQIYVQKISALQSQSTKLENAYQQLKDGYSDGELLVTDRQGKKWKKYVSWTEPFFSILYPLNWKIESSVFVDEKNNKVAEFSPGLVEIKLNKPCFEKPIYETSVELGTIKQESVTIGRYQGERKIDKVMYEGGSPNWNGVWYPNEYCLKTGNKAFYLTFYEYSEKPTQQKLYEQILTTLKINE